MSVRKILSEHSLLSTRSRNISERTQPRRLHLIDRDRGTGAAAVLNPHHVHPVRQVCGNGCGHQRCRRLPDLRLAQYGPRWGIGRNPDHGIRTLVRARSGAKADSGYRETLIRQTESFHAEMTGALGFTVPEVWGVKESPGAVPVGEASITSAPAGGSVATAGADGGGAELAGHLGEANRLPRCQQCAGACGACSVRGHGVTDGPVSTPACTGRDGNPCGRTRCSPRTTSAASHREGS